MIETFGLFFSDGKHNDQRLWDTVWSENWGNIQQYLDPNTVKGIADRGFSRCQSSMQLLVPGSIQKGNTQRTTEEANRHENGSLQGLSLFWFLLLRTRKLTHYRGTVERVFGRGKKKFKILGNRISNKRLPSLHKIFRNLFGVINHQCPPLITDTEKEQKFVDQILKNENICHDLAELLTENSKGWKQIQFSEIKRLTKARIPKLSMEKITMWNGG